jgi:signal transduction histidine kinase
LAIARKIAEAHDGYIEVKSQPGVGSTFSLHLPSA